MYLIYFLNILSEKGKSKMLNVIADYFQYNPVTSPLVIMTVTIAQQCEHVL